MKVQSHSPRLLCAYALMVTLATGVIAFDPVKRHSDSLLADVPIPTPREFKSSTAPRLQSETLGADRLARR